MNEKLIIIDLERRITELKNAIKKEKGTDQIALIGAKNAFEIILSKINDGEYNE